MNHLNHELSFLALLIWLVCCSMNWGFRTRVGVNPGSCWACLISQKPQQQVTKSWQLGHDFASLRIRLMNMIKTVSQKIAWAGAQHQHHEWMLSQFIFYSDAVPPPPMNAFPAVLFSWIWPFCNVLYVFLSHAYISWFCLRCKHSLVRGEECNFFVAKNCKEVAFFSEY